ncbi:MAG: tetratricopeptide repeat protein [Spirochaetes bacterium]|nr:tetratricopeptide repeat protein [Spirochaetota bacterium]
MKMVKLVVVLAVLAGAVFIGIRYFGCSFVRDYTVNEDKKIRGIMDRIEELEKEKVKDTMLLRRLGDQYSQLGTVYLERGLWEQAVTAFEKSVARGKTTPEVLYSLGLAYANRGKEANDPGDIDRAESLYRRAVAARKNFSDARNALAILLFFERNERERGLAMAREVVAGDDKYYIGRFTLGRFYYEMDRPREALAVYEELYSDLEKLPPSEIIEAYKKDCRGNIQRIMAEMVKKKEG